MRSPGSTIELTPPRSHPVATTAVTVHREADAVVMAAWADLEAVAACSIYQTRAWLLAWIATLGHAAAITPFFVLATGADNRALALLCLGWQRHGPLRIAGFLGGKDSNFNMALTQPDLRWGAGEWRQLLTTAARQLGPEAPDAFILVNQPATWSGLDNPLRVLPHQPSPSAAFGAPLPASADAFFAARLSKDSRKKLRKKEARLAETGPLTHTVAATTEERAAVLDCFFAQRLARFRAQNITSSFDDPRMRRFIEQASLVTDHGVGIELHALRVGPRIVAVYGGAAHGGHWSGMVNSFDADPEIARNSPGDLLLMKVIAAQCEAGRTGLDLGVGEARYKATFCERAMPLFDSFVALTIKGRGYIGLRAGLLRVKRGIKQNPRLLALAKRLRAMRGRPSAPDQAT